MTLKKSYITIIFILSSLLGNCQYSEWTNYSFAGDVNSLAEEDSLLWIATDVGLTCLNKNNLNKKWYDHSNSPLLDNRVLGVVVDKSHTKWLGTRNGLYRFNNEKWEIIDRDILNIGLNHIYALSIENDSIIWFYTKGVLWKYNNGFTRFNLKDLGLKNCRINCIAIDSLGNKWLGTSVYGVIKFNEMVLERYNTSNSKLPDNDIESIYVDSKGQLFVGTWDGLYILSGNKQKVYKRFKLRNTILEIPSSNIVNIAEDKAGNIWLLTDHNGIWKYDNRGFTRYNYWNTDGKKINSPNCVLFDSQNIMWLGIHSFGGHLFKYNHDQWENIIFTSFPIKSDWYSMQMLQFDHESNLWIGADGINTALSKRNDKEWVSLNGKDIGVHSSTVDVKEMAEDSKGNRWFVSDQGLHKYDGKSWEIYRDYEVKKKKYTRYDYSSIAIDSNDNIWIGTRHRGLFKFNGKSWLNYSDTNSAIPSNSVSCLLIGVDGNLWMRSGTTLTTFDLNEKFTVYSSDNSSFPKCRITKLAIDSNNNLWVGTDNHGLLKFDGKYFYSFSQINNSLESYKVTNAKPLKDLEKHKTIFVTYGRITAITDIAFENSTTMWVGTDGKGLIKISDGNISYLNMENSGLLSNRITRITFDENAYKWVAQFRKGISRFK